MERFGESRCGVVLHRGDNLAMLKTYSEALFDSVVTDPPYGLGKEPDPFRMLHDWLVSEHHEAVGKGFMGKVWDAFVPQPALWKECLRVLKPGGHLLAFGGTRTHDLVVLGLRIAGFEIRDQIAWVYGNGFPKSRNLTRTGLDGWGTALKPAMEPIVVARKPPVGTIAENVSIFGTGGLNIEACRIPHALVRPKPSRDGEVSRDRRYGNKGATNFSLLPGPRGGDARGRWPANVVHDGSGEVRTAFPETKRGGSLSREYERSSGVCFGKYGPRNLFESYGDSGSVARFFYCAKASGKDREEGLDGFEKRPVSWSNPTANPGSFPSPGTDRDPRNRHPTVKPTALMRWLCRLVTPAGGLILDPFMGSGSTGKAAVIEGFRFVGIDVEEEYVKIAEDRIKHAGGID